MRAGESRREWSAADVAWLKQNAGRMPKRELCRRLKRSSAAVSDMAARIRRQGFPIDLRHYEPRTITCPSCGRKSATAKETGICRPCQLERRLTAVEWSISELLARLPEEERATYERTEAKRGARVVDPMPRKPRRIEPVSYYQACRDAEEYEIAMEQWDVRRLMRDIKAAQRRKERIQRKM